MRNIVYVKADTQVIKGHIFFLKFRKVWLLTSMFYEA